MLGAAEILHVIMGEYLIPKISTCDVVQGTRTIENHVNKQHETRHLGYCDIHPCENIYLLFL